MRVSAPWEHSNPSYPQLLCRSGWVVTAEHDRRKGILQQQHTREGSKIICSPSYVDIRSRANTTIGLDYEHMIKARAHKGGVRIGKTPKKLASICCP
jgi:hypothetical protein